MGLRLIDGCFNTQPPEGGWEHIPPAYLRLTGFNTQPPEGGWSRWFFTHESPNSFNTQPPEGGWLTAKRNIGAAAVFQHTAA